MQWQKYIVYLELYSNVYFYLLTFLNKSVEKIIFYIISEHTFLVNFKDMFLHTAWFLTCSKSSMRNYELTYYSYTTPLSD